MADRPIFRPTFTSPFVHELSLSFHWNPGFALVQKQKNIQALHDAAAARGLSPVLEISTKSNNPLGRELSAFNLPVTLADGRTIPLEAAFQGSKVFENGGPYRDIYSLPASQAKRDARLRSPHALVSFDFQGQAFPINPKTAFYDWLYVSSLALLVEQSRQVATYAAFSDIEFNPKKSFSCQARSCALFVALRMNGIIGDSPISPQEFLRVIAASEESPAEEDAHQGKFF